MTRFRARPKKKCYQAFIVEPSTDFAPKNWQDKPRSYRVLEYVGAKTFSGTADAWRFLHNQRALKANQFDTWAILLD
jgi:hypothetical protein